MPKSEREEMLSALTSRLFSAMVEDIALDVALQSHHEVARSRAICNVCHTRCGSVHVPGNLASSVASQSRAATPLPTVDAQATLESSGTRTSTPTSVRADGNIYLECLNCQRQIASNRYAPHLSSCMGLGNGMRRGATRGSAKSKNPSEVGRSASPTSDAGYFSEESKAAKGKGKSKSKSKRADDAEFNLKRKRPVSPQISPNKKQKKQKTSGSPVTRVKAEPDVSGLPSTTHHPSASGSQSKVPSKLRDSSTASFIDRSSTPGSSRSSSPGFASVIGTPTSSGFSGQSPSFAGKGPRNAKGKNAKTKVTAKSPKRPSPPRPPPPPVQDYTIDIEGEETGSSTDTDSP